MIKLFLLLSICTAQAPGCELDRPMVDMDRVFKTLEQCQAAAVDIQKQMQGEPDPVPSWQTRCIMGWKRPS